MGARADALARQFEAKVQEATGVLERLSEADWKKVTAAEKWSVGVVAHHMAGAHELLGSLVKAVGTGQAMPGLSMNDIHAMNARHAQEHAGCTKSETLDLHRKGAAAAAAIVRGLGDADLDRSASVLKEMPSMTAEQLVRGVLIHHIDEHLGSIRSTIG